MTNAKSEALDRLAVASRAAVEAELVAAEKLAARRAAVRDAFNAGNTAPAISEVLGVSPQRAYQMRDHRLQETG